MSEEMRNNPSAIFFTGTFTDKKIEQLSRKYGIDKENVNEIATTEVRLFLERIRQTIETMVQQAQANLQKTMAEIVTEKMNGKLSATQIMDYTSQINTRAEQMAQAWRRVKIVGGNYELNKAKR